MAADDPRFDPQVDLNTRLQYLRPLIASANLINNRFGRKVIQASFPIISIPGSSDQQWRFLQVVSQGMRTKCTCHGVSGSCSVRTCWRSLSSLSRAAAALSQQSARASVLPAHSSPRRAHRPRRAARLRYVTPSPDYCEPDPAAGSLGTHGRYVSLPFSHHSLPSEPKWRKYNTAML